MGYVAMWTMLSYTFHIALNNTNQQTPTSPGPMDKFWMGCHSGNCDFLRALYLQDSQSVRVLILSKLKKFLSKYKYSI